MRKYDSELGGSDGWDDTKCAECGEGEREFEDLRDPPTDEGNCLCLDCYIFALEEALDFHEQEAKDIKLELKRMEKEKKKREKK